MQFIKTLIERFYLVPLPRETYMQVYKDSYRIIQVGKDRIWYSLDRKGSPVNMLKLGQEPRLTIVGVRTSPPRKLNQKPRYIFDCRFVAPKP